MLGAQCPTLAVAWCPKCRLWRTAVAAVTPSAPGGGNSGGNSRGNPWVILMVVSLGFFMTLLDLTIVNIAIPNMISKLHASLDDILWVINAYALVLAVLLITAGRLGDLIGPRTVFFAGVALFTAASAACGLALTPGWL